MIPHRPPPGVPAHLLMPADRAACAESDPNDWARACREANTRATFEATADEREQVRQYGLVVRRKPGNLGEHHIDDSEGRQVLLELGRRQRGGA